MEEEADDGHRVFPQQSPTPSPEPGDDWVHLGEGEQQAKDGVNIGSWYRQVQSQLKDIPSSPSDYQSVLTAIEQLQVLFDDVLEKKEDPDVAQTRLTFSFDDLTRTLSIKQDSVFKVLVSFQKKELEIILDTLDQVEQALEQESEGSCHSYQERQEQLDSEKDLRDKIESCHSGLQAILDTPKPTRQASFVQQQVRQIEHDTVGLKSQVYRESESVRNNTQVQLVRCQGLEHSLSNRMEVLEQKQKETREEYLGELTEVEDWLSGVYSLLCLEPVRDEEGGAYQADYGQQLECGGGEPQDPGLGYDSSEDHLLSDSGSSVGADPVALETSVDADLEEEEYMDQVSQRVFSPVDDGLISPPLDGETDLDQVMESQPLQQQASTDLDALFAVGGVEEVEGLGSDVDTDTVIGGESTGSGSTVQATRGSKEQVEVPAPEQPSDEGAKEESGDSKEEESVGSREEGSGSYEEESEGSVWSDSVDLLPMTHDPSLHRHVPHTSTHLTPHDITTLLDTLQAVQAALPGRGDKVQETLSNVGIVMSTSGQEEELCTRVEWVERVWAETESSLAARQAQLRFEKQQQTVRAAILTGRQQFEAQPTFLMLTEEVSTALEALTDYFEAGDYETQKDQLLTELQDSLSELEGVWSKGVESGECGNTVRRLKQAFDTVTERFATQKAFLEDCLSQWRTFQSRCTQLGEWLDHVEDLVAKEMYGYDITETEEYYSTIKTLKGQLPSYESQFTQLFEQGTAMIDKMAADGEPSQFVDQQLSSYEQRWSDLVTQDSGAIDQLESAVKKVVSNWKSFNEIYTGVQSFVTQMTKMVGTEPLETSNGDHTKLSTYMTYHEQLSRVETRYNQMVVIGNELSANQKIGNKDGISSDLSRLQVLWNPLTDNISDSLKLLMSEYNDWIMMKLQKMAGLVRQAEELVKQKVQFVESFPLADLFDRDTCELLKEADTLVANQDQLDQLENDCTDIEEDLLQRQVQQETSTAMKASASSLELPATVQERERLQENRVKLQTTSDALQPIINVFYLQLQLLQNLHDGREMVDKAMECVGEQGDLENMLADLDVKLSGDFFEGLSSEAFDLGAVAEDCEHTLADMGEQDKFTLPPYEQIAQINRSLGDQVDSLSDSTDQARLRLELFIQWWTEYRDNHEDLGPWLEGAETRLDQLVARGESTQPPLVSPAELVQDVQELLTECDEKQVVLNALSSTSANIIEEMTTKGSPPGEITDQASDIQERFTQLYDGMRARMSTWEKETDLFDSFLTRLTGFLNWLNEFLDALYDEVCIRIQPKASEDIISRHRNKLEEYRQEVSSHTSDYQGLLTDCQKWGDHLIPDETVGNLPSPSEPSPPPLAANDDFLSEIPLPYVRKRVDSVTKKWTKVRELIVERQHQLEISGGTIQTFFEELQNLTDWIDGKLKLGLLSCPPPANLNTLREYQQELKALELEMEGKVPAIEALTQSVAALKQTLSPSNAELVDHRMEAMDQQWNRLETEKDEREKDCLTLVPRVKSLWTSVEDLLEWVGQKEATLTECGSIGANLPRLEEQNTILKALDEELLEKRKEPDELISELRNLLKECLEGSGADLDAKSQEIENRVSTLNQDSAERQELCEEALSSMQELQKKVDAFVKWLEGLEKNLDNMKATKKPIGTVQLQLDEFYDLMRDVEAHTDDFLSLLPEAKQLSDQYKPSDVLDQMMDGVRQRWTKYVEELVKRVNHLVGLSAQWEQYESEVKGLLDWITDEANKFSKKVTTAGDEGIEDHIISCKEFTNTMSDKEKCLGGIRKLADELKVDDGVKKNGTSDVESRLNDVNQHWQSLCKLLEETMLHLESTFAEVRHVIRIRREEFDWLEDCELAASDKIQTQGEVPVIEQEIETHTQLITEAKAHQKEREFIERTITYLIEHSRKENREPLKAEALDFCSRYEALLESETVYVGNLEDSIPFWEDFKQQSRDLALWVDWAKEELDSERVASGNATVTKSSLENAQNLRQDTYTRKRALNVAGGVGDNLKGLVVKEDQQYIVDTLDCLRDGCEGVEGRTENLVTTLDERLMMWQVFPVEEARVVQEFLDDVSNAMDEDVEEELSADQLLEKIEQLESLQEAQQSSQHMMSTIEQSVSNDDIKKALERNPDISKERSNLLQGWSSVSGTLKGKITAMKQKASMVKEVEALCRSCEARLKDYQSHIDTPLPPSVLLVQIHAELTGQAGQLHNRCQSAFTSLQASIQKYDSSSDQPVPAHLKEKATSCSDQFSQICTRAEGWAAQIKETVSSWSVFSEYLKNLSKWCKQAWSEVTSLQAVHNFAMDFASLEYRLQKLTEEFQERRPNFDFLSESSPKHCTGDHSEVSKVREQYTKLNRSWKTIEDVVNSFPELIGPWKELTELFDKICSTHERLKGIVDRALAIEGDSDGGNLSEIIHCFKDCHESLLKTTPQFQRLNELEDQLLTSATCKKSGPARELKQECAQVENDVRELTERVKDKLRELEDRERRWKEIATDSMERLPELEHQLAAARRRVEESENNREAEKATLEADNAQKENEIRNLQRKLNAAQSNYKRNDNKSACGPLVLFSVFLVLFLVALLLIYPPLGLLYNFTNYVSTHWVVQPTVKTI